MSTQWSIDASHSSVSFSVRHLMITNVRGSFEKFSGSATYDAERPEASQVTATIDVASITTGDDKRDGHLRSGDFFDAEKFPSLTFTSRRVARRGDGVELTGDLTIRGVTREDTLAVDEITAPNKDPWGNVRVGASAKTKIKRSDFGITWNSALETGGVLVGDDISIAIDVSLVKQA